MLQLYYMSTYLLVNDKRILLSRSSDQIRDDQLEDEECLLKDATWDETKEIIESGKLTHRMYVSQTSWKKKPYISALGYDYDEKVPRYFKDDKIRFSLIRIYVLDKYYTMEDVMKHARADQAVQWFKERGLSVCPLQ